MKDRELIKRARKFANNFRVEDGDKFRLGKCDPGDTLHLDSEDEPQSREILAEGAPIMAKLQDRLFAQDRWAVLLIFQAMDAAGKDGAIKHVMSGLNPRGCQVYSFKAPTPEDLDHDYLWRCMKCVPERGRIGIFNRSYYEEVLVVRAHPELLAKQKIPPKLITKGVWDERYQDIRAYERYLSRNGVLIRKFFLNVSKKEQKRRFLERIENADKNWKFSADDARERAYWDDYMRAYEQMVRKTSTKAAPWHVIPADNKWFSRLAVASVVIEALDSLKPAYPAVDDAQRAALEEARLLLDGKADADPDANPDINADINGDTNTDANTGDNPDINPDINADVNEGGNPDVRQKKKKKKKK